jgi:hypothetical protein
MNDEWQAERIVKKLFYKVKGLLRNEEPDEAGVHHHVDIDPSMRSHYR